MAENSRLAFESLSLEQRRALEKRLLQRRTAGEPLDIPRRDRSLESYPLSYGQQRLWFLHQLGALTAGFNIVEASRIRGPFDFAAFTRSLNEVVQRHEVLRTTFELRDGAPVQRIVSQQTLSIPMDDLRAVPAADRENALKEAAAAEFERTWDMEHGPLIRARVFQLEDQAFALTIVLHHVVSDGWSRGVLVRELAELYGAQLEGRRPVLPDLPIQCADYALWEHQYLQGKRLEQHLDYWRPNLAGLSTLQLPRDHRPEAGSGVRGGHSIFVLPPELTSALRDLSRKEEATLFMTLLAAYAALLGRYGGQEDVTIGSPMANRTRLETENLIGCFMNPLPLRMDLSGNPTFRELLQRARKTVTGCFAHQGMPFDLLVRAVQPKRVAGGSPLFQAMFILQGFSLRGPEFPGLTVNALNPVVASADRYDDAHLLPSANGEPKDIYVAYPVMLEMVEAESAVIGSVEFASEFRSTLSRMPGHLRRMLDAVVADPNYRIREIPILTDRERTQILVDWKGGSANYAADQPVHRLFEAQAARTPEAEAVVFGQARVTYRELNERANRLAHELRGRGVRPDSLVGVLVERSVEMVVAVLGILKAGGAYVPLDPAYPRDRLDLIVRDTEMPVLITHEKWKEKVSLAKDRIVCLDSPTRQNSSPISSNLAGGATADHLAYVIYTSGSTGVPKGVMVTHRNLANAYFAWEDAYALRTRATAHLQMASFSFDVFSGDFVRALCSGGKLVITPYEFLFTPSELYSLMKRERVDCAEFVPAVLRQLVQYLDETGQRLEFMKLLIAGSDVWYGNEYRHLRQLTGPGTRVINSYGLTEATIDSTFFDGEVGENQADRIVPIGRPFPNTELYILDSHRQPVPVGVPGEIFIGGVGVARGYWNRPELTDERFIPHPLRPNEAARVYRTGDLGRFLSDGNVEMLGRVDQQVKLRGVRIELGEIESVLSEFDGIREAVAAVREDTPGDQRLVAYLVAHDPAPNVSTLRDYLGKKLPKAMHPGQFVFLPQMPLTPNGKIDRNALPKPASERRAEGVLDPPSTDLERSIAEVWREVLGVSQVGLDDNFFDLGGHSMLVVQVHSKLRHVISADLTIVELFEFPTVRGLAQRLERGSNAVAEPAADAMLDSVRDRARRQRKAVAAQGSSRIGAKGNGRGNDG